MFQNSAFVKNIGPNFFFVRNRIFVNRTKELLAFGQRVLGFRQPAGKRLDASFEHHDPLLVFVVETLEINHVKELQTGYSGQAQTKAYQYVQHLN